MSHLLSGHLNIKVSHHVILVQRSFIRIQPSLLTLPVGGTSALFEHFLVSALISALFYKCTNSVFVHCCWQKECYRIVIITFHLLVVIYAGALMCELLRLALKQLMGALTSGISYLRSNDTPVKRMLLTIQRQTNQEKCCSMPTLCESAEGCLIKHKDFQYFMVSGIQLFGLLASIKVAAFAFQLMIPHSV